MSVTIPGWLILTSAVVGPMFLGLYLVATDKGTGGYISMPDTRSYVGIALIIAALGIAIGIAFGGLL